MLRPAQTISQGEEGFAEAMFCDSFVPCAAIFSRELSCGLFDVFWSGVKVSQKYSNQVDFLVGRNGKYKQLLLSEWVWFHQPLCSCF